MNKPLVFGSLVMVLSIVLAIIMMALEGWRGNCNPGESSSEGSPCYHVGMRTVKVDSLNGRGGDSFNLNSDTCKMRFVPSTICDSMYESGTIIMATGIIAFVLFIVAMVLLCVAHRRVVTNYRYGALALLYLTSALMTLGSVLYAEKAAAGYSFILMIVAGFFYFCGVGLVLGGGWKIDIRKGAQGNVPNDASDTH